MPEALPTEESLVLTPTLFPQVVSTHTLESSAVVSGIVVRVPEILILDTRPGFFEGSAADVYPLFLVVMGPGVEPVSYQGLSVFAGVEPGSKLPVQLTIARALTGAPTYVDVHVLLMRSRVKLRDTAKLAADIMASEEAQTLIREIGTLVSVQQPLAGAAVGLTSKLITLLCQRLSEAKDRQIFYGVASFENVNELTDRAVYRLRDNYASVVLEIVPK